MSRVFTSLADPEFNQLFTHFRHTAYRLETLQHYAVDYEQDEFARFLAGETRGEFPGIAEWIEGTVKPAVAAGKRMQRVHVVELPVSDYVRFEWLWAYEHTVKAGEEVGIILTREGAWPARLPRADYWLFDSELLVTMNYADDGQFVSAEMVDDPRRIEEAIRWRDTAVAMSVALPGTLIR